jgi:DNA-binding transcriptional regulator YiaG
MWSTLKANRRPPYRTARYYHNQSSLVFPDACALPLAAKEIRDIRLLLGYSQTRLAATIGIGQISTISDWEQGIVRPSAPMLAVLSKLIRTRTQRQPQVMRTPGTGVWERGEPRLDAAAQWGRGDRIGVRPRA